MDVVSRVMGPAVAFPASVQRFDWDTVFRREATSAEDELDEGERHVSSVGYAMAGLRESKVVHVWTFEERIDDVGWLETLLTFLGADVVFRAREAEEMVRKEPVEVGKEVGSVFAVFRQV